VACIEETFSSDPFGNPIVVDEAQRRILEGVRDYDRVAVRAGRGIGKTASAAMLTHYWLTTRYPALVVTSAGSWAHLTDKLWPEIGAWGKKWKFREAFEYQSLGIYHNVDEEIWKAVGVSSDKPVNVEGFHNPNFLLLIDEAKGMPDEIFAALLASLSGDSGPGTQKCVALSTPPTADAGWYANACHNERWHQVHVSGLDSPRVSREYIEDIADTFGESSAEYQAYVLGEIPEGVTGQLIRSAWVREAQEKTVEVTAALEAGDKTYPYDLRYPVITCDVARGGEDLCTIGVIDGGLFNLVRLGNRWGWFAESNLMDVVKWIGQSVLTYGARAVCLDDTGLGGGVTDRLRELQTEGAFPASCTIWPVNFGAKPRRPDRFFLRKDEIWWSAREALRAGALGLPTDEMIRAWRLPRGTDFKGQLLAPIYESDLRERIRVYDKRLTGKEATKGLPLKSPDLAHALILGVDYYQRQEEHSVPLEPPKTQEEALARVLNENVEQLVSHRMPRTPFQR
jgi:hypothetical protein